MLRHNSYKAGKSIQQLQEEYGINDVIKLASNENPLGSSPNSLEAARTALNDTKFYPNGKVKLKCALSAHYDIPQSQLIIGNGSEAVLSEIINTLLSPGHTAIMPQYTFALIPLLIKNKSITVKSIPNRNFQPDIERLIGAIDDRCGAVFIVNPNNPTNSIIDQDQLVHLLENTPDNVPVIVDEAYFEYVTFQGYPDTLRLLRHYPNLIIVRTFSKMYGLAGLRVGYAMTSEQLANKINNNKLPFDVNSVAAEAAVEALKDSYHKSVSLQTTNIGRKQIITALQAQQLSILPGDTNFITIHVGQRADMLYRDLLKHGIIVKSLEDYGLYEYIRVTIGTQRQNDAFLKALDECLYNEYLSAS